MASGPLPFEFLQSASKVSDLPESEIELAVLGRSNVGKSSLLNAIANRKNLARTSKTPGATRLINVFEFEKRPGHWLVDLPGYGYAKVPEHERARWQRMIEEYLTSRETVTNALVLIDGEVGPTKLDLQTVEWLEHIQLPALFVATKMDKVKPSKSKARRTELASKLGVAKGDILWVSAAKSTGLDELRSAIMKLLELND